MRPDVMGADRTRSRAARVIITIAVFYILLLLAVCLCILIIGTSIGALISGIIFLGIAWQALTLRAPSTDPRRLVDLKNYPGLAEALADAAMRVDAPLPDGVRITTAARIYANEEGGLLGGLARSRRILVVGAAALPFLTDSEARTLLARALARWSGNETWYGAQARRVELAVGMMMRHLRATRTRWINPVYWMFYGFHKLFPRVLAAYVWERELWADQVAAQAYTHADAEAAVRKQVLYDAFWFEQLAPEFTDGRTHSFDQLWGRMLQATAAYGSWDRLWHQLLSASRSPSDYEPTLGERLNALSASTTMPAPGRQALTPASATLMKAPN